MPGLPAEQKPARAAPQYELKARYHGAEDTELDVWQVPSPATPQLKVPLRVAGLRGRNLALVEHRVLRRLKHVGVTLGGLPLNDVRSFRIDEDTALNLGLLSRPSPRCAAPTTCAPAPRASRQWGGRKRPTGSAWQCTARIHAGCSPPCANC